MVICFDYGLKYIGVAVGQNITKTSSPLECIYNNNNLDLCINNIFVNWKPNNIVVGINCMDNTGKINENYTNIIKKTNEFILYLSKYNININLENEYLSSWYIKRYLKLFNTNKKKDIRIVNSLSACVILEQWLN